MGGGSTNGTTQTVINQQDLPAWYQSYLQDTIGRATSEAAGQAPIYSDPRIAGLSGNQNQAIQQIQGMQGQASPLLNQANQYLQNGQGAFTQAMNNSQSIWSPGFDQGLGYGSQAAQSGVAGAQQPYLQQAQGLIGQGSQANPVGLANPYIQQGVSGIGLQAAQPYLNAASQSLPQATMNNLSPYLGGALNALSDQASYDLQNKYLPAVNDSFIRAGQFGSTRNQDITAQTIHDLSNTVQQNQAGLINQAYGQAGQLAQQNLGLQGQLAQTAGGLGTQQQQALLQAGQTIGGLGTQQGQLALQGANAATGAGSVAGQGAYQQGQLDLGAGQLANQVAMNRGQLALGAGQLSNQIGANQTAAAQGSAGLGVTGQNIATNDANALYSAGAQQQNLSQQGMNTAYQDWLNQTFYPQNQTQFLSNIVRGLPGTQSGYTQTTATPTNTGAQVGGLLTAGLSLAGGQGQGASGAMPGYYRRGGRVKAKPLKKGIGRAA